MNKTIFTAVPLAGASHQLHQDFKDNLKKSFISLIETIGKSLPEKVNLSQEKIENLDTQFKISPAIYYIYFDLLASVRRNDVSRVLQFLKYFDNIPQQDLYKHDLKIENIKEEFWEHELIDNLESRELFEGAPQTRLNKITDNRIFNDNEEKIKQSLDIIKKLDPIFYQEVDSYLSDIKIHKGQYIVGLTSPKFFGCVFLSLPRQRDKNIYLYYIEHITHETSHLNLNAILLHDRLVINNAEAIYPAPIRKDLRPMLGVYHASYVLSRVVRIFNKIKQSNDYNEQLVFKGVDEKLEEFKSMFLKGIEVIEKHAVLTSFGKKIFDSMMECANG